MAIRLKFFLCLFLLNPLLMAPAQAANKLSTPTNTECGQTVLKQKLFTWCVSKPKGTQSQDVLYHLHGANGNEHRWSEFKIYDQIRTEWAKTKKAQPVVISVSFGGQWLLTDIPDVEGIVLRHFFVKEVMPYMEEKIGGFSGQRFLMGDSMGGFNAAQLFAKSSTLFAKVVLNCPAISTVNPYSSEKEMEAFFKRHAKYIRRDWVSWALLYSGSEFATEAEWQAHDPLVFIKNLGANVPPILVTCGSRDQFGFNEGVQKLYELAKISKVPMQFKLLSGGHCRMDPKLIVQFLTK